jgi:flagellar hook-length control protein FliK
MTVRSIGQQSQMNIRLKPEILGNVRLQVLTENHQVMIRMNAESHAVKEIVEQNLQYLKSELQQHGLEIHKFDVFVQQDNDAWKNGQNAEAFAQSRQQQRRHRHSGNREPRKSATAQASALAGRKQGSKSISEVDFFA